MPGQLPCIVGIRFKRAVLLTKFQFRSTMRTDNMEHSNWQREERLKKKKGNLQIQLQFVRTTYFLVHNFQPKTFNFLVTYCPSLTVYLRRSAVSVYVLSLSGITSKFAPPPSLYVDFIHNIYVQVRLVTQLSIPTHAQLQRHRLKFIKNHLKTPTCFGLRPSSGS